MEPTAPTEFVKFAPSRRTVAVGDVFAALPNDGRGFIHGQVLRDDVNLAGAVLLLVVFFKLRTDTSGMSCADLASVEIAGRPFLTNRTGWFDGVFSTLHHCDPRNVGRVGLRAMSTDAVFDLSGQRGDATDFDLLGRRVLSPYGAIAIALGDHIA